MSDSLLPGMGDLEEDDPRRICSGCKKRLTKQGRSKCNKCLEYTRKYRERCKLNGICTNCGSRKSTNGKPCDECRSKRSKALSSQRDQRIKDHLCTRCGNPNDSGKKLCQKCSSSMEQSRLNRKNKGLCTQCGEPSYKGLIFCERHYKKFRERLNTKRTKEWSSYMITQIKTRSKKLNYEECNLTKQDLLDIFEQQCGKCYWLGIPMEITVEYKHPLKVTPDRLDCTRGYVKGNVILSCLMVNVGRMNFDAARFREILATVGFPQTGNSGGSGDVKQESINSDENNCSS